MRILAIAQVEDDANLRYQIAKQTVQPDGVYILVDKEPAKGIDARRKRIAENHQFLTEIVQENDHDLVWQVEGDCELPDNCLERLLQDYDVLKGPGFGYVSGIQVGRHGLYCLGAWRDFTDTSFESLDHKLVGFQEVEATGFYCLLAPRDVWLSGIASWNDEPYGPDVVWSRSIDKKKYCDMDLPIGHIVYNKGGLRGVIKPSDMSTCNARFYYDETTQRWKFKQL